MSKTLIYQNTGPSLLPLYARAIIPKGAAGGKKSDGIQIPELSASIKGVTIDRKRLRDYRQSCGFSPSSRLPITWPHIEAFPLHIRLMSDPDFPLPLLGLVHLRNRITQQRPILEGECLDLECRLENQVNSDRGIEFDIVTRASSGGREIWQEASTILYRQSSGGGSGKKGPKSPPRPYSHEKGISAPEDTGRRYGRASGDLNPIHLHALSAKAFGFPRAIAHGMWTMGRTLALMEEEADLHAGPVMVDTQFKTPLFLPGTATLSWDQNKAEWPFMVLNSKGTAPHLEGRIQWL
ncbi:MAG: MaoC/PaaZ C-terminal domain-containing protein [Oleiphilaceae bacterium]|nr:MaoC/PaaZ C-terminal domain-containing protein [Oleiphilaceae bacterium]